MLKMENFSLSLGDKKILDNISFTLDKGKVLGIVGPSGVGKTSLLNALVGLYSGDSGILTLNDEVIYENEELKKYISYVPDEHPSFQFIKIKDIIEYYKSILDNFSEEKFHKINKIFKIPINKRFFNMSKGMKARVSIMVALASNPKMIVLDEPTSGLDPILKEKLFKILMREVIDNDVIVIVSSHQLVDLERICDEIIMLDEARIAYSSSLENMKKNIKKLQVAFEAPVYEEDLNIEGIFSISTVGRVFTIVTDKYDDEFKAELNKFNPLFVEEIDLSLEEAFIHKLDKGDNYEEIFK
ncbi:MAG: ABC transporter ATP-binding protein [Clostridium sp.]